MQRPSASTIAWYEQAVPGDARAVRGQMFGHPCAFVNGHMFFGTFADSVVARVGPVAVEAAAAAGTGVVFEPMEGRAWREYLQVQTGAVSDERIAALASDALDFAAALPPKPPKGEGKAPKSSKRAGR